MATPESSVKGAHSFTNLLTHMRHTESAFPAHGAWDMLDIFAYVFAMFASSPSPIMEAAFGRFHNGGPVAFGRRPTVVDSIMGDGEAAHIVKT